MYGVYGHVNPCYWLPQADARAKQACHKTSSSFHALTWPLLSRFQPSWSNDQPNTILLLTYFMRRVLFIPGCLWISFSVFMSAADNSTSYWEQTCVSKKKDEWNIRRGDGKRTVMFCLIRSSFSDFGTTAVPRWTAQLMRIWPTDAFVRSAIARIDGSLRRVIFSASGCPVFYSSKREIKVRNNRGKRLLLCMYVLTERRISSEEYTPFFAVRLQLQLRQARM